MLEHTKTENTICDIVGPIVPFVDIDICFYYPKNILSKVCSNEQVVLEKIKIITNV